MASFICLRVALLFLLLLLLHLLHHHHHHLLFRSILTRKVHTDEANELEKNLSLYKKKLVITVDCIIFLFDFHFTQRRFFAVVRFCQKKNIFFFECDFSYKDWTGIPLHWLAVDYVTLDVGCTGFYWVFPGIYLGLESFASFLTVFSRSYWVFYLVNLDWNRLYRVLPSFPWFS